jgi:hypothetical protein
VHKSDVQHNSRLKTRNIQTFLFITASINYASMQYITPCLVFEHTLLLNRHANHCPSKVISYGLGRPASTVTPHALETFLKLLVSSQIIFLTGIMLAKLSILQLYLRIFTSKSFRIVVHVIHGIVLAWWLAFILLSIFQCKPIDKSYRPWKEGRCISLQGAYYGSGLPDILTDVIILCLPLWQVAKIQTSRTNKLVIGFLFASGVFATFTSINRLIAVFQVDHLNGTATLTEPLVWAVIEQASAIVSACLPTLRPLLMKLYDGFGLSRRTSSGSHQKPWSAELVTIGGSTGNGSAIQRGVFHPLTEDDGYGPLASISGHGVASPNIPDEANEIYREVENSVRMSPK